MSSQYRAIDAIYADRLVGWISSPLEPQLRTNTDKLVFALSNLAIRSLVATAFDSSKQRELPLHFVDHQLFNTQPGDDRFGWEAIVTQHLGRKETRQVIDRISNGVNVYYKEMEPIYQSLGVLGAGQSIPNAAAHIYVADMFIPKSKGELYLPLDRRVDSLHIS